MPDPNFILLYVDNPPLSARFYADLLGRPPVETSPTFAMFALDSGAMLGLWSRHTVAPPPAASPGAGELAFAVADNATVGRLHADWGGRGLRIAQAPTDLDFGHTFVALDPDGHRLRVFAPTAP
jgi:catechol 2,3-dioxygenase-like lactoylglutathione lyase family enzyme